jgi:hypothetical protein
MEKPKTPQEVYVDGILLYTITDWFYVDSADTGIMNKIMKPGWFPVTTYNGEHPIIQKKIEDTEQQQLKILDTKNVDWEKLSNMRVTI